MAILLSQLCQDTEKTYHIRLAAGRDGLENPVRWVHMIEDATATDFIHGNELVFTTGIRQHGTEWLLGYVVSLRENGAAGLVLNIGPYITSIPQNVLNYCEKNSFPLFTLPWEIHIIDVTYDFCHRIIRNEENETGIAAAFRNLIFSPEQSEGYKNSMLRNGFHNESDYQVLAISLAAEDGQRTAENLKSHRFTFSKVLRKSKYAVCTFIQENYLVVVRQKNQPEEISAILKELPQYITEAETINIGISTSSNGWRSIPRLYNEAVSAMAVARHRKHKAVRYSDIGVYKLLFGVRDTSILVDYVNSMLGSLMDYDEKNKSDYVQTLRSYLENDGSVQNVAAQMNVHRNTINYKMKIIRDILGNELHNGEKMNYMLAFRVQDMLNEI